jgi:hypothetical protein
MPKIPQDEIVDDYYAAHSAAAPEKKGEDDSGKKGLKLKIKAKVSVTTGEEPKIVPTSGASLIERPKPKIVIRPATPRREEPQQPIKAMPRSVIFDDAKGENKKEEPIVEKKFVEHVSQPRHEGARLVARNDGPSNTRPQAPKKPDGTPEKPRWNNDSPRAASNDFSRNNNNKKK